VSRPYDFETPTCAVLGCHIDATAKVRHPDHGPRVVCSDHVLDYEAIDTGVP